jgi:hypothetical protein
MVSSTRNHAQLDALQSNGRHLVGRLYHGRTDVGQTTVSRLRSYVSFVWQRFSSYPCSFNLDPICDGLHTDIDQLLRIMTLCGTPDEEFMKKITSEEARNYIKTLPTMKRRNLKEIFKNENPDGTFALFFCARIVSI